MCSSGQETASQSYFFDPGIKCCTYVPNLPNFLAGSALLDASEAGCFGRDSVDTRIAQAIGVTPLGLTRSPVVSLLYDNSTGAFGRNQSLRCPHYLDDGGRCGIWQHRNAVCSTWFCKHVRGETGHAFWRSLQDALTVAERNLAKWCVLELELGHEALHALASTGAWRGEHEALTRAALDDRVDAASYARIWGAWGGREQAFYGRCAELVDALSWQDVVEIGGAGLRAQVELARAAFRKLTSDDIAAVLKAGSFQVVSIQPQTVRVSTYSPFDPLDVPTPLLSVLSEFDGRPTADVLAGIESDHGIRLEPALIRKMADFKLLVPSE